MLLLVASKISKWITSENFTAGEVVCFNQIKNNLRSSGIFFIISSFVKLQ